MPPPEVIWEMLWELYELNFCQDLVALDNCLDESGMNLSARCTALDACWFGSRDHIDSSAVNQGLAFPDAETRIKRLKALYKLMRSWSCPKPPIFLSPFPEVSGSHNTGAWLNLIERELACFYMSSFLEVFAWAASIPFRLT
ncbi:hypothetical protein L218DRAFT_158860 [Marasmius fiardii PR-910]|nr:hypothetical protein L218DRAFT_158860 [Marasmius fiardii PR-910]